MGLEANEVKAKSISIFPWQRFPWFLLTFTRNLKEIGVSENRKYYKQNIHVLAQLGSSQNDPILMVNRVFPSVIKQRLLDFQHKVPAKIGMSHFWKYILFFRILGLNQKSFFFFHRCGRMHTGNQWLSRERHVQQHGRIVQLLVQEWIYRRWVYV